MLSGGGNRRKSINRVSFSVGVEDQEKLKLGQLLPKGPGPHLKNVSSYIGTCVDLPTENDEDGLDEAANLPEPQKPDVTTTIKDTLFPDSGCCLGDDVKEVFQTEDGGSSYKTLSFRETVEIHSARGSGPWRIISNIERFASHPDRYYRTLTLMLVVVMGLVLGHILKDTAWTHHAVKATLVFLGQFYGNVLFCLSIPLAMTTLALGTSAVLGSFSLGHLGFQTIIYFILTSFLAALEGSALVCVVGPTNQHNGLREPFPLDMSIINDMLIQFIRLLFPNNLVVAFTKTEFVTHEYYTRNITEEKMVNGEVKSNTTIDHIEWKRNRELRPYPNIFCLFLFAVAFGVAIERLGIDGVALKTILRGLQDSCNEIVKLMVWLSPLGILFTVAQKIIDKDMVEVDGHLFYTIILVVGCLIHSFIILPFLYVIVVKKSPIPFLFGMADTIFISFFTGSSMKTLPVTMRNLIKKNRHDRRIVSVVAPLGAVVNMDGVALTVSAAFMFGRQANGMALPYGQYAYAGLVAVVTSLTTAEIPGVLNPVLIMVLSSVGVPPDEIAVLLYFDWFIDLFVTLTNVMGDAFAVAILEEFLLKDCINDETASTATSWASINTRLTAASAALHRTAGYFNVRKLLRRRPFQSEISSTTGSVPRSTKV